MAVALAKSLLDSPSLSTSTLGALSSALATVRSAAAAGHWLAATFVRLLPGKPSCRRRSKRGIEVHLLKACRRECSPQCLDPSWSCAEKLQRICCKIPSESLQKGSAHEPITWMVCRLLFSPEIESTDDARALVLFAHKYGINSLLDACEEFLVELAQGDMSDGGAKGFRLFTSFDAVASWTELADDCNLNSLLAHCELSMIKNSDMDLWCDPAMTSGKISRSSLVRILRASQLFIHRSTRDQAKHQHVDRPIFKGSPHTVTHRSSAVALDHHVDIETLMQWKREVL
ncbi:hypothetical protein WJX79_003691 [Trebouxia sp. C0005]